MPAALTRLIARLSFEVALPQPAYLAAALVALVGIFVGAAHTSASAGPRVSPLYPQSQTPVVMVDEPRYTVAELIETLPQTERFGLLLSNTGVLGGIEGSGPYTIFAPANNYFDYLPRDVYVGATRTQERALAERHIVSGHVVPLDAAGSNTYLTLGGGRIDVITPGDGGASVGKGFIIGAYRARNGVVYITNNVLVASAE